jgi:HSP20 family molecular chaperone IbpA
MRHLRFAALFACLSAGAAAQEPATVLRLNSDDLVSIDSAAASRQRLPDRMTRRRADDRTPYIKFRQFFMPDTGVDPLQQEFEKLYGEPDPIPGNRQFSPWRPFEDVEKWNRAFDRAAAGLQSEVARDGTMVAVRVDLPEAEGRALEVYVNEDRILLSLSANSPPRPFRIPRRDDFTFPLPERADVRTASVSRTGGRVLILFRETSGTEGARP